MEIINGDILKVRYGIVCHQVNCKGKMGAGLALAIRKKWPQVYKDYMKAYRNGDLKLGNVIISTIMPHELLVANLCGQDNYGRKGKYTDYNALKKCLNFVNKINITNLPICIPHGMSCTLAGGNWKTVSSIIEDIIPDAIIIRKQ